MPANTELTFLSVTRLAELIRQRGVSATEVVAAHLQRIDTVNPRLNAVLARSDDAVLEEARAADKAIEDGEPLGPLHSIPMTIKDSRDTVGLVSTWGTPGRSNHHSVECARHSAMQSARDSTPPTKMPPSSPA